MKKLNETTVDGIKFELIEEADGLYISAPALETRAPCRMTSKGLLLEDGFYCKDIDGLNDTLADALTNLGNDYETDKWAEENAPCQNCGDCHPTMDMVRGEYGYFCNAHCRIAFETTRR